MALLNIIPIQKVYRKTENEIRLFPLLILMSVFFFFSPTLIYFLFHLFILRFLLGCRSCSGCLEVRLMSCKSARVGLRGGACSTLGKVYDN